jgi:pyruvate-formate lyase
MGKICRNRDGNFVLFKDSETPEHYKSLTVRLYGFSEYFVSLPKWQQLAVLNRTAYSD